ncbi:putative membrane protein DUF2238 [Rhodovulum imhoffii]|uniref:Putative membrane protein DUF2238 n=1 Tax=Rhodovulum imhoffii TaxID=365340 RepID=A0A2T5BSZ9_9RHOB|nr:DUF2238 domain-containing protein [Rhodovulum imhoffii]PTN02523.1 putative membrane protein DUF2238 [Rhodovulum imhoffii]
MTRAHWAVLLFTLGYVAVFSAWFLGTGNTEFLFYVVTMLVLIALVALSWRKGDYPLPILWALSLWGLAHMAGGGVPVGDSVLYAAVLVPVVENAEMTILKYDQAVHAYGFGVTAWLLHHLLVRHYPPARGSLSALAFPALGAMGLGAVNEIVEFIAVLAVPETNVGGYVNTALDLVFNAFGACITVAAIHLSGAKTST